MITAITARQKFMKGQRVKIADAWVRAGYYCPSIQTGIVVGFGRTVLARVYVRHDGQKSRQSWHMDAWEPMP